MTALPAVSAVTLKEVARAAGVHFSTVSLALRGSLKVSTGTRHRVQHAAAQLGYRPDPVNFALTSRRQLARDTPPAPLIAFVTNRETPEDFFHLPHMPGFLAGAQAQAQAMGFSCELLLVGREQHDDASLAAHLATHGAQGVILGAFMPHQRRVQLDWSRYAVVKIDSWFLPPAVTRLSHDQQQIVRLACQRLHALGYRRLGLAVGQVDEAGCDDLYRTAMRLEQHLLGLAVLPPLLFTSHETAASSVARLGQWVRQHRLDAVLSNWRSIRQLLEDGGLRVPGEVACASLCLHQPDRALAGTVLPHFTVGRKAVEMIALFVKTRQLGVPATPATLYVEGEWHDGVSAPARK